MMKYIYIYVAQFFPVRERKKRQRAVGSANSLFEFVKNGAALVREISSPARAGSSRKTSPVR